MSTPSSQNHDVENQLRDWGRAVPRESRTAAIHYSDLVTLRNNEQTRIQRNITVGFAASIAALLSCLVFFEPQPASKFIPQPSISSGGNSQENLGVYVQELPTSSFVNEEIAIRNYPSTRHTLISHDNKQLRQRWLEAKRVNAQAQVLQQWLAENR